jgi:drug/metabolite transporter (DMT)-like permease
MTLVVTDAPSTTIGLGPLRPAPTGMPDPAITPPTVGEARDPFTTVRVRYRVGATVVGPVLGERVRLLQWVGLCLGFIGVTLVLWEKLIIGHVPWLAAAWSVIALFAITAATIYQKRFCPTMDWRTGGFVQYAAVALLVGSLAMLSERGAVRWEAGLVVALGYLVIVLSIGAITLLNWLIRRGRAARIASLFYLVPPVVALESWLWFGEKLGVAALVGMGITAAGVALVNRS